MEVFPYYLVFLAERSVTSSVLGKYFLLEKLCNNNQKVCHRILHSLYLCLLLKSPSLCAKEAALLSYYSEVHVSLHSSVPANL